MANNLRVFNTNSEYQSADLILPAVSYVVETDKVIYEPTPVFQGKWLATYSDSHTESAQCGSSSEIDMGEINLDNLVSVEIGDCVTSIGGGVFGYCTSLTSVNIPNSVTEICLQAFFNCSSLTSIDIPNSVTEIGGSAFEFCTRLTSVTVNATTPPTLYSSVFDGSTCPIYVPSASVSAYKSASGWSEYEDRIQPIPSPTPSFKWKTTYSDSHTESAQCDASSAITDGEINKSSLESVEIGDCVTSIGDFAFRSCTSLTSIDIPDNVTSIGEHAFYYCRSLTSIDIPSGVTSIGDWTFNSCTSLTSIDIPNSVTSIGNFAFRRCFSLTSCTIGSGVTSIGQYAFYDCSGLTSCTIGSGVTSIGEEAVAGCIGLTSITVEATTPPTLGTDAFNGSICPIYVPSASLTAYEEAWSRYAGRIQPIP